MTHESNPFRLDNEIALITGGGSGLGLAIARCMVTAGARVVITGRREDVLRAATAEIGQGAEYLVHDVTQFDRAAELMLRVKQLLNGFPTILVNNAGNHLKKPALQTPDDEFAAVLDTHVRGSFALTRAAAPHMIERGVSSGGGSVLFIASMASLFGIPQVVAYSAAKSAYLGLVRSLAVELSGRGVRVNAIAPGWIDSPMLRKAFAGDPERERRILQRTPMAKLGEPTDVGNAAVYLCSPAAKFVTGAVLTVDGGISIGF
jgi:NAD(P)-dependent dehydrogenase (short-subunit alcohol dehydrogenase family)